ANADASGIALQEQTGSSTVTTRSLDRQKRLKHLETRFTPTGPFSAPPVAPALLQRLSYQYGQGGLLKSRFDVPDDTSARVTEDFEYDFLSRLTNWTVIET